MTEMAIFALKLTVDFYHNQDTTEYKYFLDAKKAFNRVNHWTLAIETVRQKRAVTYCEIVHLLV